MSETMLEARSLCAGYGPTRVVHDLDLVVSAGEVVALLGPNGAGKTTTLLSLAGEIQPQRGEVLMAGRPVRSPTHRRARAGLGYITEERSVFMQLTVLDNLRVAGVDARVAMDLFPELQAFGRRKAGDLSGGQQQMLALARMLARQPTLLLADELSLGLAPLVVKRLLAALRAAADNHRVGVLLVEQHVRQAMAVADRVYVLSQGRVTLQGPAAEVRDRIDEVEAAYLATA